MTATTKACNCIGPDKCGDIDCIVVRNYRAATDRVEDRLKEAIEKILDQFVDELECVCTPDDSEYQDLEDSIIGEPEKILLPGLPPNQTITSIPGTTITWPWSTVPSIYPSGTWTSGYVQTDPCATCTNNPANGGSGNCVCSIPYMSRTISSNG